MEKTKINFLRISFIAFVTFIILGFFAIPAIAENSNTSNDAGTATIVGKVINNATNAAEPDVDVTFLYTEGPASEIKTTSPSKTGGDGGFSVDISADTSVNYVTLVSMKIEKPNFHTLNYDINQECYINNDLNIGNWHIDKEITVTLNGMGTHKEFVYHDLKSGEEKTFDKPIEFKTSSVYADWPAFKLDDSDENCIDYAIANHYGLDQFEYEPVAKIECISTDAQKLYKEILDYENDFSLNVQEYQTLWQSYTLPEAIKDTCISVDYNIPEPEEQVGSDSVAFFGKVFYDGKPAANMEIHIDAITLETQNLLGENTKTLNDYVYTDENGYFYVNGFKSTGQEIYAISAIDLSNTKDPAQEQATDGDYALGK